MSMIDQFFTVYRTKCQYTSVHLTVADLWYDVIRQFETTTAVYIHTIHPGDREP